MVLRRRRGPRLRSPRGREVRDRVRLAGRAKGFTLIEMLVVIAIIALLASITIPVMSSVSKRQKSTASVELLARLKMALQQYNEAFGDFPPSNPRDLNMKTSGVND